MSKYLPLWEYIKQNNPEKLTFSEINIILGFPVDHSFLQYKKELESYGYKVQKISMKNQVVFFSACESEKIEIKRLSYDHISEALSLVWEVFCRFEATEYSPEGTETFRSFLDNEAEIQKLIFYGAFYEEKLVGVLAMRKNHISLFFVNEKYHRRGIGRKLFEAIKRDLDINEITVHSSPYAVKIYEHLGFKKTDNEQTVNGIRYIPMKFGGGSILPKI